MTPPAVKIGPHPANVSPELTSSARPSYPRTTESPRELRKRTKRIKELKSNLQSLRAKLIARQDHLTKDDVNAIFSGIEAHKELLKLVYGEDLC